MAAKRCLYCYESLPNGDFHPACSRKFFGTPEPPEFPYALNEMHELANQVVRSSVSVTGVQAKLSLDIETFRDTRKKKRLTIVGMWGRYVLKPPTENYPSLPEIEDLTMHIAALLKIRTVPHTLIRIKSGELAYITRRVDRVNGEKLHMEDMCQLTERLTEDKYKGSMEQIGRILKRFSDNRGFDLVEFFRLAVVSFLIGNADMHLKNFSLLQASDGSVALSPAYDLVATKLVLAEDMEETALSINGKKRNLRESDFRTFSRSLGISDVVYKNTLGELAGLLPQASAFLNKGFLDESMRDSYRTLLEERSVRLGLIPPNT
jgi:serine/threonine-protein kinase HipA